MSPRPASFIPPISQLAYRVADLDQAIEFWARHLGVGPFRKLAHLKFEQSLYRGRSVEIDLSIALAWGGGVQIELLQQHSSAPSVFSDYAAPGGLHHAGIVTADIEVASKTLLDGGMTCIQSNISASGTLTRFFEGPAGTGLVELIQSADGGAMAERLRQAAHEWNGEDLLLA